MCGIIGMISENDTTRDTIERLALLEYRGYDSFGLAAVCGTDTSARIELNKDVGSVSKALASGRFDSFNSSHLALAHTRWATHGGVTARNAHPHMSFDGRIAIAHNGVIDNHMQLRRALEAEGIQFRSQTDSEVVAHLIAKYMKAGSTVLQALTQTITQLTGEYALGVIALDDPTAVYGAKRKSPLVVAFNGHSGILASDQMAMTGISKSLMFLEDNDIVRLTQQAAEVFAVGSDGSAVLATRQFIRLDGSQRVGSKGTYSHWMIKEINEVPQAIRATLIQNLENIDEIIGNTPQVVTLVGAGSAFYVAQIGQYLFATLAKVQAVALASDEADYLSIFKRGDRLIALSQSGETFDTLEVCRAAVAAGTVLTSISNVPNSTQERLASHRIQQGSGPEICVLSTKSIISQVSLLARIALQIGHQRGTLPEDNYIKISENLRMLPNTIERFLMTTATNIESLARKYSHVKDWFFIGRGVLFPVACESALKFKEVSYRHAEGMAAGFFKHGTISLIDTDFYTIALLPSRHFAQHRYSATLAAVSEIAARGGPVIGLGPIDILPDDLANFVDYIGLPYQGDDPSDVILQLVAGQLLAYYCALDLGREIDQPRSLAKSVTVR